MGKSLLLHLLVTLLLVIMLSVFVGSSNPPREFGLEYNIMMIPLELIIQVLKVNLLEMD